MKTMSPVGYHHNGALWQLVLYSYTWLALMNQRVLNKVSMD